MDEQKYKKAVQGAFDEASAGYDRPAMRFFDNSAENLARAVPVKGHERVLDAATGTGKIAIALAKRLKGGHVTGIDLSDGMLSAAGKKAEQAGLKNVSFQQGDVDTVDFPSEYFDGLTCGFGVHFWSDMEKSLSRLAGMVKPEGFVAISSFAKGSFEPHSNFCLKRFAAYGVKLPDSYTWERLDHPDKIGKLFKAVGLKDAACTKFQAGYYLDSVEDWWDLVRFTGFRAFLNQLTDEQASRYKKEFLEEVDATRDGKGVFLNVEILTAIGKA